MDTRLAIEIPLSLKRQINIVVASDNISLKDYLIKLIEEDLKRRKPVTLKWTETGIKVKSKRSKNQSYKFVPERIIT